MARDFQLDHKSDRSLQFRLITLMLTAMGISALILVRAIYLQLLRNPKLDGIARRQFQSRVLIRPRRGSILDSKGEPLAVNSETNSLAANPNKLPNKRKIAQLLAQAVHIPVEKLERKLEEKREFTWIKRHLLPVELKRLRTRHLLEEEGDLSDSLWLVKESERVYPRGELAAHVLGDVNVDSDGLEGVELWKNDLLRGQVTSVLAVKDALGRPTFIDAVAARNVQDGQSVTLTIDSVLQFEVEQKLRQAVQKTGAVAGTVIVMDAVKGDILVMANEPRFNPNERPQSLAWRADHRRNRAVTDGYEPGSTFKAILATGILKKGGHLTDLVWGERGFFLVQGHAISEAEARERFEWVSLKKMIQVSSNVAAAKFALSLGADQYLKIIQDFGFGVKTQLGFPGEIAGRIPSRKEWSPLTLANIGFGQGLLVTPLQMTRAYAAILNGGCLVKPHLIREEFKEISPCKVDDPSRIFSQNVSHQVIEALESVTSAEGTGAKAAIEGFRIAGKTGTAQWVDPKLKKYSKNQYIASFIGFPLDVDPKLVIFTSLDRPQGVYYASQTAVPLFNEVLLSVANRCGLPRVGKRKLLALKSENLSKPTPSLAAGLLSEEMKLYPLEGKEIMHVRQWVMPSLKGLTPREVMRVLQGHRLDLEISGRGMVFSQIPEEGKPVAEGSLIRLKLTEP